MGTNKKINRKPSNIPPAAHLCSSFSSNSSSARLASCGVEPRQKVAESWTSSTALWEEPSLRHADRKSSSSPSLEVQTQTGERSFWNFTDKTLLPFAALWWQWTYKGTLFLALKSCSTSLQRGGRGQSEEGQMLSSWWAGSERLFCQCSRRLGSHCKKTKVCHNWLFACIRLIFGLISDIVKITKYYTVDIQIRTWTKAGKKIFFQRIRSLLPFSHQASWFLFARSSKVAICDREELLHSRRGFPLSLSNTLITSRAHCANDSWICS